LALAGYKPQKMWLGSAQKIHSESGWFVSVSNTPTFGGGLKIAPQASVSDGLLDVTFVSAEHFSRARLASHFPKILSGNHVNIRELSVFATSTISVETDSPSPVYADGERITQTPCKIEVAADALRLVTASVL
jgi:diacylglycerol kinase family enzyme